MELRGKGSADKITTDVSGQNKRKQMEERLRKFVKKTPITIEYGCHTIHLCERATCPDGFNFEVTEVNGSGIVVQIY